ncbi:MAG: HugZ family protein [Acetobacteraceae bacterium]
MTDSNRWAARKLLRAGRVGSLATSAGGHPFVSLVTPATAPDLSILLLLSDLSEHTRHLRQDPRCAVLVAGAAAEANPQTIPRVTVVGVAEPTEVAALKERYLAIHPYAALYAGFADFHLWRIRVESASFVGGFGRAARFTGVQFSPDPGAVAAVAGAEAAIGDEWNRGESDVRARMVGQTGDWRLVAVDVDGCDLRSDERVIRIHWKTQVANAAGVRKEMSGFVMP